MTDLVEVQASEVPPPRGHFSHAIRSRGTVFVSGLLALNAHGEIVAPFDARAQTALILKALEDVLASAGASKTGVAKLTIYLIDLADRAAVGDARAAFFGAWRPASTMVEVSGLAAHGAVVEIDAIAVTSSGEDSP